MANRDTRANDPKNVVDIDERRLMAALSYVGVLVFIPLLTKKNDPFVYWHAKQGLVMFIAIVVALVAASWIEVVGILLFAVLMLADLVALVKALLGKQWPIPVIFQLSQRVKI